MKSVEWDLLRGGDVDAGLNLLLRKRERETNAANIVNLGIAYLWSTRYGAAFDEFALAISNYRTKGDVFYGMAGVAKWCLGEPAGAVQSWNAGLAATHARTAGLGITIPLLLYFVASVKPEFFRIDRAITLLKAKARDPRILTWGGPIAKWIIGEMSEEELRKHCTGRDVSDTTERNWHADFYGAVMRARGPGNGGFKETMRLLSDISAPEFEEDDVFSSRIWKEEFFLARHEGAR